MATARATRGRRGGSVGGARAPLGTGPGTGPAADAATGGPGPNPAANGALARLVEHVVPDAGVPADRRGGVFPGPAPRAAEACAVPEASALADATSGSPAVVPVGPVVPDNGTRRRIDGVEHVFFHGYWVRHYTPIDDSLASRKRLIDNLTRRAFHHTEPGINTPGERLDLARAAHDAETDPALRRVNAAMLAGALFNRATDIFTTIVELEEKGVRVSRDNELMRACGDCFKEALELGRHVRHHSGEEGIDELWGEPFRAFTIPIEAYYESRFIKVAQTMRNIDRVAATLRETFPPRPEFAGIGPLIDAFAAAARRECETMRTDACIFEIWPRFVAAGEALAGFAPDVRAGCARECVYVLDEARHTLVAGRDLINWIARARVPMPKSTANFVARCASLRERLAAC